MERMQEDVIVRTKAVHIFAGGGYVQIAAPCTRPGPRPGKE